MAVTPPERGSAASLSGGKRTAVVLSPVCLSDIEFLTHNKGPAGFGRPGSIITASLTSCSPDGRLVFESQGTLFSARGGEGLSPPLSLRLRIEQDGQGRIFLRPVPSHFPVARESVTPFTQSLPLERVFLTFARFFSLPLEGGSLERLSRLSRKAPEKEEERSLILASSSDKGMYLAEEELEVLVGALCGVAKGTLLGQFNRREGRDGRRWILIPIALNEGGNDIHGSLRILCYSVGSAISVDRFAVDVTSSTRRWLFQCQKPGLPGATLEVATDPPLGPGAEALAKRLSSAFSDVNLKISVSSCSPPSWLADCRITAYQPVDEEA